MRWWPWTTRLRLLYAYENDKQQFDEMIPEAYRPALSYHHPKVVSIPSFSFATPVAQMGATGKRRMLFYEDQAGASRYAARDDQER